MLKDFLVSFCPQGYRDVTYPITAKNVKAAKEEFSRQYIGVRSDELAKMLECEEQKCPECGTALFMAQCPVCD